MIKSIYLAKIKTIILLLGISSSLTSCAIYSAGFNCPDSRGARCMMLSDVDVLVDSGEIETIYQSKKCKRGKCGSGVSSSCNKNTNNIPRLDQGADSSIKGTTKYYIKN